MNTEQQQLRDYVLARLKQGISIQTLTHELMTAGWDAGVLQPVIIDAQRLHNQHAPIHENHRRKLVMVGAIIAVVVIAGLVIGQMLAESFNNSAASRQQGDIQVELNDADFTLIATPTTHTYSTAKTWQVAAEPFYLASLDTYQSSYFNYNRVAVDEELIRSGVIQKSGQPLIALEQRSLKIAPFSVDEMYEIQLKIEMKRTKNRQGLVDSVNTSFADSSERKVQDVQTYVVNGEREVVDYILNNVDETLLDQRRIRFFSADGTAQAEVIVNRSHSLRPIDKTDFDGLLELVSSVAF